MFLPTAKYGGTSLSEQNALVMLIMHSLHPLLEAFQRLQNSQLQYVVITD